MPDRAYYQKHKERLTAYNREWRKANPEHQRRYYGRHREACDAAVRRWKAAHPDTVRRWALVRKRRRRAIKANAVGSHTYLDWLLLKFVYNFQCPRCKRSEPDIRLSEDHIVPLVSGGSDSVDNLQPLCINCNVRKGVKAYCVIP